MGESAGLEAPEGGTAPMDTGVSNIRPRAPRRCIQIFTNTWSEICHRCGHRAYNRFSS